MLKLAREQFKSVISRRSLFFTPFQALSAIGALACSLALDAGMPAGAQTLTPKPTWTVSQPKCPDSAKICIMTIKIFNNDPNHWIYPVLTTGKGPEDIWMQAWWSVPNVALPKYPFTRRKNYRLYINPTGAGIPPSSGVEVTVPIFTQLVEPINAMPVANPTLPSGGDTLINWWNGAVIQVYTSPVASPPKAITQALARTTQKVIKSSVLGAVVPTCVVVPSKPTARPASPPSCQPLTIYSDDSDLAKNDPSQLIEYTFGARNDPKDINAGPRYLLDTANVDFDVSYVNVAFAPAVMGPYKNDQVGYIGTPITIQQFETAIDQFLLAYPGWPQFLREGQLIKKLASPLEVFARLGGKDPPPDLTQVPGWPATWPTSLWAPIQELRTKWTTYAGKVTAAPGPIYYTHTPGLCGPLRSANNPAPTNFCDTIAAVQNLMIQNYRKYRSLYAQLQCPGTPYDITDNLIISHVYGWAPWTESSTGKDGDGCKADQNKLEKTPYYSTGEDYTNYLGVKVAFDKLNYGTLPPKVANQIYNFNPWVQLIHGVPDAVPPKYINTPYAYAYSVDDAMGNIQAEGQGIIIDIGSTINLENQKPATQPIEISLGGTESKHQIRFTHYAVCKNTPERKKTINPNYTTIVISSNDPASCPVYVWDSKVPSQLYAFKIDGASNKLPLYPKPPIWMPGSVPNSTTSMIACTGLPDAGAANGYQPTSATFCCDSTAKAGVYAYSVLVPDDAHHTKKYKVTTTAPMPCKSYTDLACWAPPLPPIATACNKGGL
jgi:hypothetical protein